jgi:hypothetical protein
MFATTTIHTGQIYEMGHGVPADHQLAIHWYLTCIQVSGLELLVYATLSYQFSVCGLKLLVYEAQIRAYRREG